MHRLAVATLVSVQGFNNPESGCSIITAPPGLSCHQAGRHANWKGITKHAGQWWQQREVDFFGPFGKS